MAAPQNVCNGGQTGWSADGVSASLKRLYSRRDDVTLANPFGAPARGWQKVAETLERAASQLREGKVLAFERISEYATAELAYIVEI